MWGTGGGGGYFLRVRTKEQMFVNVFPWPHMQSPVGYRYMLTDFFNFYMTHLLTKV